MAYANLRQEIDDLQKRVATLEKVSGNGISAAYRISLDHEYDRLIEELKSLNNSYDSHQSWSKADLERKKKLKARMKVVRDLLGVMV